MEMLLIALLLLVIMGLAVWSYFELGPILSEQLGVSPSWGEFGSFFGGVVGPLVILLALLAMLQLLRNQHRFFATLFQENKRLDMMRYLSKIDENLMSLLNRDIKLADGRLAQFGDFIDGIVRPEQQQDPSYKPAMDKLLKLSATYCEAIDNYRTELGDQLVFAIHQQRARDLVQYLEKNPDSLNPMSRQSISYCKMHLQGSNTKSVQRVKKQVAEAQHA